jgi:hypothetical protein
MRIVRHDHGTITSGMSYCYRTFGGAEAESKMHDAPRGVEVLTAGPGRYYYLARAGEGEATRHYGMGGHYVALVQE